MAVMFEDIKKRSRKCIRPGFVLQLKLSEIRHADDTLLFGVSEAHLAAVYLAGTTCGMELDFGKLQLISTQGVSTVCTSDGTNIFAYESIEYLGTTLCGDGHAHYELK